MSCAVLSGVVNWLRSQISRLRAQNANVIPINVENLGATSLHLASFSSYAMKRKNHLRFADKKSLERHDFLRFLCWVPFLEAPVATPEKWRKDGASEGPRDVNGQQAKVAAF